MRRRLRQENVFDILERQRKAPVIQKYVRGYLSREKVAIRLHKFRMKRQLQEQEAFFSPKRLNIMESLQITIAYMYRKKKAKRLELNRLAEIARIEKIEQEKRQAARERRLR